MNLLVKACSTLIVSMACLVPARALTVWDPGNFVVNAQTAMASVATEISAATTATQNIRQTIEMIRMGTSIQGLAQLAGLQDELKLYTDLVQINGQLTGAINETKGMYQHMNAYFGASNSSWETFLKGRAAIDTSRAQYMIDRYDQVNRSMSSINARRVNLLKKVDSSQSHLEATQVVSGQVDLLISQNQQMMSLLSNQMANDGMNVQSKTKYREGADQEYKRHQQRLRDAAANFK